MKHFTINKDTGEVKTTKGLDRESISRYQLSITAVDVKAKCHKGLTILNVVVNDVDDNKPKFDKDHYVAQVREDAPSNQYMLQVVCNFIYFCCI